MWNTLEEHYFLDFSEIPLFNYEKCLNGEYHFARKDKTKGNDQADYHVWKLIYDQYLKKFGIGREYSMFLDKVEELTLLNCEYVETENRFLLNGIRRLEREIEDFTKKEKGNFTEQVVIVSKWLGSRINTRETTADEFYTMVEMIKKEQSKKPLKNGGEESRE